MTTQTVPSLRPYQVACLEAILAAREAGQNRVLIQAATGAGKTQIFGSLPARLQPWLQTFPDGKRQMLVIAHRDELIDQAARRVQQLNPGLMVGVEQGDRHTSRYADVTVASIQTLTALKCRRLKRLLRGDPFRLVIYDESHHASSPSARTALVHLGFLPPADASDTESLDAPSYEDAAVMAAALETWDKVAPRDRLLVGFTATPNRSDGVGLGAVFQQIVFTYPIKEAIDDGWLVPIVAWTVETNTSLDAVKISHGDFNQGDLAKTVNTEDRNRIAVAAWQEHAEGRPTLAFTVDVAHAHALAEAFTAVGVRARAVSGETPKDERRGTLDRYTRGEIDVITNCQVFTEGTDLPATACILNAKPTKSATLFTQIVGRGLRTHPGKSDCLIIDLVDVARRHSLQSAPVLYGLPPSLVGKGDDLRKMADELEAFREKYPGFDVDNAGRLTLEQLRAKAQTFDIWTVPSLGAFGNGRALTWIKVGDEHYRLSYPWLDGTEILAVQRDILGHYDVSITLAPSGGGPKRQRTIATEIPTADDAAGVAEKFVLNERRTVMNLKAVDAKWHQNPASEKQIRLLQRLRVPVKPGLKMGEASRLIDVAKARRV